MIPLDAHYKYLEDAYSVTESGEYASLVVPTGNTSEPIHRWFHLKEAFSHSLLGRIVDDFDLPSSGLTVVDPFSGSGTTAISATGGLARRFEGFEVNPYLHLLASTKLRASFTPVADLGLLAGLVIRKAVGRSAPGYPLPELSTFRNEDYFDPSTLLEASRILFAIDQLADRSDDLLSRDLLKVALASCIEPSSNLRRDGRTLRRVHRSNAPELTELFRDRVDEIERDLPRVRRPVDADIRHADSRTAEYSADISGSVDLCVFSPPYPNNIDYTEVYKLEAWFLRLISSPDEFAAQRRRSLRSHGSLRWEDTYDRLPRVVQEALAPLLQVLPEDRYASSRRQVILGYFDDMQAVIRRGADALKSEGHMAIVVGNSFHGRGEEGYVIASDVLLALLLEANGMTVDRIEVARRPSRRRTQSSYLRESVIFASKPRKDNSRGLT